MTSPSPVVIHCRTKRNFPFSAPSGLPGTGDIGPGKTRSAARRASPPALRESAGDRTRVGRGRALIGIRDITVLLEATPSALNFRRITKASGSLSFPRAQACKQPRGCFTDLLEVLSFGAAHGGKMSERTWTWKAKVFPNPTKVFPGMA